jgi:hypothetical protein
MRIARPSFVRRLVVVVVSVMLEHLALDFCLIGKREHPGRSGSIRGESIGRDGGRDTVPRYEAGADRIAGR